MNQIIAHLEQIQRLKVIDIGNTLGQLSKILPTQGRAQFRLPDEDDLQQLFTCCLEVRQEADLLEHIDRERLRLVNDENGASALVVIFEQLLIQRVCQCLESRTLLLVGHSQFIANRRHKLQWRQLRIENQREIDILRHLFEQGTNERGLPCADLPGELHEAPTLLEAKQQVRQRLLVGLAEIHVSGIRSNAEGSFLQPEIGFVHTGLLTTNQSATIAVFRRNRIVSRPIGQSSWITRPVSTP